MDRLNPPRMLPVGRHVAAAVPVVPSHKARKHRDYDHVPTGPRALEYDESDLKPSFGRHKEVFSHHKRHNFQDSYHLVVHGSDSSSRRPQTTTAPPFNSRETLEQASRGKSPELQELPPNRKRVADLEESRQHPSKKLRKAKDNRSDRLCLQCGNYHSSPCYVPLCSACDLKHYHNIPCLDASEQLKKRLELHPPATSLLSKQNNKKQMAPKSFPLRLQDKSRVAPALSNLRASTTSFGAASQSSVDGQKKGSHGKRTCPVCPECGSLHRSPCKWLVCEKCKVKHHPETPCAMAEARLKRRLEEEDAKEARVAEEIKQNAQDMIEMNNKMASTGRAFSPDVAPKKIKKLKKGTRFCRDCGRYLNGPCTWLTCEKCGTKHLDRVPCWKATQNLQIRLEAFDRGYGTTQQKIPKVKTSSDTPEPSPKHAEESIDSNHVVPAAPVDVAAMTFNFDANGQMSWSLDSNKTVHLGLPPSMPGFSVSTSSMPPQTNGHVHPSRQALLLEPSERSSPSSQPLADIPPTGSVLLLSNSRNEPPQAITYVTSTEQNVDAFFAEVVQALNANGHVAMRSQVAPSYLEYLRRNASS